jgi:hypothetical protein
MEMKKPHQKIELERFLKSGGKKQESSRTIFESRTSKQLCRGLTHSADIIF